MEAGPSPPLRVRAVRIVGARRTRPEVVEAELGAAYAATTAAGVYVGLRDAADRLQRTGSFSKVDIVMGKPTPSSALAGGGGHARRRGETDVVITLEEKSWFGGLRAGATTTPDDFKGRDGTRLEVSGRILNPTGFCESLECSTSHGSGDNQTTRVLLRKPRLWGLDADLTLDASLDGVDERKRSSYTEVMRGCGATARSYDGVHTLSYGLSWRDISPNRHPKTPYASTASFSVLAEAKPSLKSSVSYTYNNDSRDHAFTPTQGSFFKALGEWAGPGGDVNFLKLRVDIQQHLRLFRLGSLGFASLNLCSSLGALKPLAGGLFGGSKSWAQGARYRSVINDRFFVGGPLHLRGFQDAGIGPRAPVEEGGLARGDALGGDLFYTASASLSIPFPQQSLAAVGVRPFLFANSGNLVPWQGGLTRQAIGGSRLSAGFGIAGNLMNMSRVEVTCSYPLQRAQADLLSRWQVGIGLNFC